MSSKGRTRKIPTLIKSRSCVAHGRTDKMGKRVRPLVAQNSKTKKKVPGNDDDSGKDNRVKMRIVGEIEGEATN